MPMYNLLEYSDNYSMALGSLWNYYRDEINDDGNENVNNRINNYKTITIKSFEYKTKLIGVDTSDLAAKKGFIVLKVEFEKLDINKLTNVPTSLNNLKTKVNDLDVDKLKTVPADLKKLGDVVDNVVKNTKFNKLKAKVNNLEMKIPDATALIYQNQCNSDKQNLEKKLEILIKKYQIRVV